MLRAPFCRWLVAAALCGAASAASHRGVRVEYWVKHQPALTAELDAALARVSDPRDPSYGEHLSHAEVQRLQAPRPEDAAAVRAHLRLLGAADVAWTAAGDKAVAFLPDEGGALTAARLLPAALRGAVDLVAGGARSAHDRLAQQAPPRRRPAAARVATTSSSGGGDPSECLYDRAIPPCIRNAYGMNGTQATNQGFNAQAVIVNQVFKPADIKQFETEHGLPEQAVAKTIGENSGSAGAEASLDLQFIITMGQLVPTWWMYIDGHGDNPFAPWLTWASNTSQIPFVHSLSVGEPESAIVSDNGGEAIITRMNDEMKALGARGVTLLFASGDSGYTKDVKYPASSPFVTSVGGVTWGHVVKEEHITVDDISTGGFSSLGANPAPSYQSSAVQHYLTKTTGDRPSGNLNASRRCVPDLAAYSTAFYIIQNGGETPIGGTSASTPVVAGMVSSINDALIAAGHTPLGFANPFFYQNEDAFLDITHGDNNGYAAVEGYDPASGLGTFSPTTFAVLRDRALAAKAAAARRRRRGA